MVSGPGFRYKLFHTFIFFSNIYDIPYYYSDVFVQSDPPPRSWWQMGLNAHPLAVHLVSRWRRVCRARVWEGHWKSRETRPRATHIADSCSSGCCHCFDANHLFRWVFLLISTKNKNRHTEWKGKTCASRCCCATQQHKCSGGKKNEQVRLGTEMIFLTVRTVLLELCCCNQLQTFSH